MGERVLPFTAVHAGGMREISFPLHPLTVDDGHVAALLRALLDTLSDEVQARESVSDGDLLQALCMTLTIRMHMVDAEPASVRALVSELLEDADDAVAESSILPTGRA